MSENIIKWARKLPVNVRPSLFQTNLFIFLIHKISVFFYDYKILDPMIGPKIFEIIKLKG